MYAGVQFRSRLDVRFTTLWREAGNRVQWRAPK